MHFNCRTVKHPSTKNKPWSLDLKCLLLVVLVEQVKKTIELVTAYNGWKSKSGKKRLNSIKIPAVKNIQMAVITGAVQRNLIKAPCLSTN